jgi:hypothetical protein
MGIHFTNIYSFCEISGYHGSEYEDDSFVGRSAMWSASMRLHGTTSQKAVIFILFVDYEKAHDSLSQEKLWQILREEDIPMQLLKAVQSLY